MTTGKTITLTRRTFVGKVVSLLFNMLSRLVIAFLPRSKHLLVSWLQSPSAVILEPKIYAEYIMRNAGLDEAQLESRLPGEISITSEMQMTPSLWQKVKKN